MKKSFLLTLLILTISFSCQEQENVVEPEINFQEASTFLSDMFSQTIQHSVSNAKFGINQGNLEFSNSDIIGKYLQENYFPELVPLEFSFDSQPNARSSENENHFMAQDSFINDLDHTMNNLTSEEEFYSSIEEYRNEVVNHTDMSDEQKIEMLAIVEYSYALHEYLINDGVSKINGVLSEIDNSNTNGRISGGGEGEGGGVYYCPVTETCNVDSGEGGGCSVNWRNVWAGAVASGVITGGLGLKTGCAGGVVAGPIGVASGCVGGAVMGFASGFMWGAIGGIAANLITSCGR